MQTHRFHAWRRMRDLGPTWTLTFSEVMPADWYGYTDWDTQTITLREGLSFAERRCTITHEIEHVHRGRASSCHVTKEELTVDRRTARLLLPSMKDIADALVWHHGNYENAATDLWVDLWTLEVRLSALHKREREYLTRRLDEVVLLAVDD